MAFQDQWCIQHYMFQHNNRLLYKVLVSMIHSSSEIQSKWDISHHILSRQTCYRHIDEDHMSPNMCCSWQEQDLWCMLCSSLNCLSKSSSLNHIDNTCCQIKYECLKDRIQDIFLYQMIIFWVDHNLCRRLLSLNMFCSLSYNPHIFHHSIQSNLQGIQLDKSFNTVCWKVETIYKKNMSYLKCM